MNKKVKKLMEEITDIKHLTYAELSDLHRNLKTLLLTVDSERKKLDSWAVDHANAELKIGTYSEEIKK